MNELMNFEAFIENNLDDQMKNRVLRGEINMMPVFDALKKRDEFYEDDTYIPAYARKVAEMI